MKRPSVGAGMPSKVTIAYVVALISIIAATAAYVKYSASSNFTSPKVSDSLQNSDQQYSSISLASLIPQNSSTSTSSALRPDGLNLVISTNASELATGETLNISVWEVNPSPNTISLSVTPNASNPRFPLWSYPAPGMQLAPCLDAMMPAVYPGYYTAANISEAIALRLYFTLGASCPISHYALTYSFAPQSDSILLGDQPNTYVASVVVKGYFLQGTDNCLQDNGTVTASCPYLVPFPPGTYTIAGGDLWGGLDFLYLRVAM